jgi:hypothetical protein
MKMHLVPFAGLVIGFVTFATLLFSGCANGDFISTSGHGRDHGYPEISSYVDWTKPARSQTGPTYPLYEGLGTP